MYPTVPKRKRHLQYRDTIAWYKHYMSHQCCDTCGEDHPAALAWHHRVPGEKKYNISNMIHRGYSITAILMEIDKCNCMCHNCHAKLHYRERYGTEE